MHTKSKKKVGDVGFKFKISYLNPHAHYHASYYTHLTWIEMLSF